MAKTRKGKGIIGRIWTPFGHVVNATGNSVKEIGNAAGNLTRRTLAAARKLGNVWTSHTNAAIKNTMKGGKRRTTRRRRYGKH